MLALNGALLALLFWCLFSRSRHDCFGHRKFGVRTWGLLSLMCVTLTASMVGTIAGLRAGSDSGDFDVGLACGASALLLFVGASMSYVLRAI